MTNTKPRSNVVLYKTKIKAEQNVYIDNIETYLVQCTSMGMQCQYIKHDLTLDLKVNLPEKTQSDCDWNYVKIQNIGLSSSDDEGAYYYFLAGIVPVSQKACRLALAMDTVNSLGQSSDDICNPRNFDPRTSIQRQHGDRFQKPLNTGTYASSGKLVRRIDEQPENIVSEKVKVSDAALTNVNIDTNWYAIYKSDETLSAGVSCDITCDDDLFIGTGPYSGDVTITTSDLDMGTYYYLTDVDNPGASFESGGGQSYSLPNAGGSNFGRKMYIFRLKSDGTQIQMMSITGDAEDWVTWRDATSYIFHTANFFRTSNTYVYNIGCYGIQYNLTNKEGIYAGSTPKLTPFSDVNRTDSKITKIIKYPYCPIPFTIHTDSSIDYYEFPDDWEYRLGFMRFKGTGVPVLGSTNVTGFDLLEYKQNYASVALDNSKIKENESKLYNSENYTIKVQYDSFYREIPMENFQCSRKYLADGSTVYFYVDFKPTSTINSKFAFKLKPYSTNTPNYIDDYEQYIFSTRTNEETILNNEYINYIKYGDQYDKKTATLQVVQAWINAGLNVGSATVGTVFGAKGYAAAKRQNEVSDMATDWNQKLANREFAKATHVEATAQNVQKYMAQGDPAAFTLQSATINNAMAAASSGSVAAQLARGLLNTATAGISGAASAITGAIATTISTKNSLDQKRAQLQSQAASVAGTDDIDLLSYYSDNRLHLIKYQPKEFVRDQLYHMFDYSGYSHVAQETPDVDSRVWYNYIQCTPVLKEKKDKMQSTWIENLKARYEAGVTVLHHNVVNYSTTYDFDQQYENWERWFLKGLGIIS